MHRTGARGRRAHIVRARPGRPEERFFGAVGSRAAAEFIVSGTYLDNDEGLPEAKGQTYKLPAGSFFEIRDGKIARITTYYNLTDWISQVEKAG